MKDAYFSLPEWKQGGGTVNTEMLLNAQQRQLGWPLEEMEGGMQRIYSAEWRMEDKNAENKVQGEAWVEFVLWVKNNSQKKECVQCLATSVGFFFLVMKGKYKKQAAFLWAAAAGKQYHPLFACGWWW